MATYKLVDGDKLDAAMTATADAIRAKTGNTDPIAWDAEKGMSEAVEPVFEAGKKSEYDAFWDAYQNYGKKRNYPYGFYNWQEGTIKPKYDIQISEYGGATSSFSYVRQKILDFKIIIDMDLSTTKQVSGLFNDSSIEEIIYLEITNETIKLKENCFNGCNKLKVLNLYGIIGDNLYIKDSIKLNKKSIEMIVECLSNNQIEKTLSLSQTAVNNAFETSPGASDGSTSEEWTTLIATKPNWTISLV